LAGKQIILDTITNQVTDRFANVPLDRVQAIAAVCNMRCTYILRCGQ